jgi:hypothetical protein
MQFESSRRRFRRSLYAASGVCLMATAVLWADEPARQDSDELSTDRPDFTESTDTVRAGRFQLEGGLASTSHAMEAGPVRAIGGPSALLRVGVAPRVELRFGAEGFQAESRMDHGILERQSGYSDLDLAVKFRILDERGGLPAIAIIPGISFPWGSAAFSSGGHDRFLKFCWSREFGKGFEATGNANFRWEGEGREAVVERGYSVSVGHKLPGEWRGFWEVYRVSPIPDDEAVHWIADTGVSRGLGRNFHMDLAVGHTIHARTPSWIFSVGFAVRGEFLPSLGRR